MGHFLLYALKVAVCLTVLYIFMKAFLSHETFFRFNRIVLLTGVCVCFILPLVKINTDEVSPVQAPFVQIEETLSYSSSYFPARQEISVEKPAPEFAGEAGKSTSLDWVTIFVLVYATGFVINLGILLRSVFSMLKIIVKGQKIRFDGYILSIVDGNICPFSWRKYIVITRSDYKNNPDEIVTHELAHIRHRHSWDVLFMEAVLLFQWFNPAAWLLKRDLEDIHEYQADISVLRSGIDATKYQLLLVKKAVGASSYTLANSFNHSKIKKRITMMLKNESKKWARLKLLLALPLATLAVYAFARPAMNPLLDVPANKSTEILPEIKSVQSKLDVKQDNPATKQDKRELVVMSMIGDGGKIQYALPVSYDISIKNRDGIKTYIVNDKSYTFDEFSSKYADYFVVREEKDLPNVDRANVISFRCKTQSGLITPVWYLVKGTETIRDDSGVTKTYEEIYRERQNKRFEEAHNKHKRKVYRENPR
ncbi:hypothetical protein FACS1894179_05690 [Bacteroidia bacterium]|nr:hypothetical protein FACS1894179_05690 [Bacteroidia bacterium]